MAVDPGERSHLPIACTLGAADGAQRVADWRRVAHEAGAGRSTSPGTVVLSFLDLPSVGSQLEQLVAAERECCGFLGWKLARFGDVWTVEITGRDEDLSALPLGE